MEVGIRAGWWCGWGGLGIEVIAGVAPQMRKPQVGWAGLGSIAVISEHGSLGVATAGGWMGIRHTRVSLQRLQSGIIMNISHISYTSTNCKFLNLDSPTLSCLYPTGDCISGLYIRLRLHTTNI